MKNPRRSWTRLHWLWLFLLAGGASQAAPLRAPSINLSPSTFDISVPLGGPNPTPSTLNITTSGGGKIDWNAASDQPWLTLAPTSGKNLNPGGLATVTVSVNLLSLSTCY